MKLAVVGGGVCGLSACIELEKRFPKATITLFEGSPKLGGKVGTIYKDGFLIEEGPDSLNAQKEETARLIEDPIIPKTNFCYLLGEGKIEFSKLKKANVEPSFKKTLREYVSEAYGENLVPLFAGVYGGDPDRVSSLVLHGRRVESPWGVPFVGPRMGMGSIVQKLRSEIKKTEIVHQKVSEITENGNVDGILFDGVVSACPNPPYKWDLLDRIPKASAAIVTLETEKLTDKYGSGVICRENGISGATFSSVKWEGRAPEGKGLSRVFFYDLGGNIEEKAKDFLQELGIKSYRILLKRTWENEIRIHTMEAIETMWLILDMSEIVQFGSILSSGIPDAVDSGRCAAGRLANVLFGDKYGKRDYTWN